MKLSKHLGQPEIFFSLQGEGKSAGVPSIFIRTALCNLHCIWCDTDYTWNWENTDFKHLNDALPNYQKFKKAEQIATVDLEEIVKMVTQYDCENIILTGGEPMLQQTELTQLMEHLLSINANYTFEVETNGTIVPNPQFYQAVDQFNVSPKLLNSGMEEKMRLKEKPLEFFAKAAKANFKFVVSGEEDIDEILALKKRYNFNARNIYLMPEGRTAEELDKKVLWVVEKCKKFGFNFSNRSHIYIWGAQRGV